LQALPYAARAVSGCRQAQGDFQILRSLPLLIDHHTDEKPHQRQDRAEHLQFDHGNVGDGRPFDDDHDAELQYQGDQRRPMQALPRRGPDDRQKEEVEMLEPGIGDMAEHQPQHQ
jgi:hypothetical protein